jgi:osmotically-inducible protein OsmY
MNGRVQRFTLPIVLACLAGVFACDRYEPEPAAEAVPSGESATPAPARGPDEADPAPGWITTKIRAQYFVSPEIKPWNIDVTTSAAGVVTLTGEVDSAKDRAEAVRIARATEGVIRVQDMLTVEGAMAATSGGRAPRATSGSWDGQDPSSRDLGITTTVKAKYYSDDEIRGHDIDVETRGGIVTLRGTVDTYAARRQAVALARNSAGVREVRDELRVQPAAETAGRPDGESDETLGQQVTDAWIATKIQSKYFLDADVKGRDVSVSVENGTVTLTGSVDSEAEKKTAEQIARETEGVGEIRNLLTVGAAGAGG